MYDDRQFLDELQTAIRHNRILLPTLPEVALRVRDALERESTSAQVVAKIVSSDAAVSARLLQVANSPLYRGRMTVDSLQMAVTRLGVRLVRSLVMSLAMRQMFQANSQLLDRKFRQIWEASVQIAAISRILAKNLRPLDVDQAMLAGLIHDIGALPILVLAEGKTDLLAQPETLDFLLERLTPTIGQQILKAWDFPAYLIAVAENYNNFAYDNSSQADYVDVVIVARLESLIGSNHPDAALNWVDVRAFDKVGLPPDTEIMELEGSQAEVDGVREIFLG